ncbi:MAG: sulfatase [Acidobacteria bacterium]|nr:sulfatase [Acidobacteriota bacterium]
MPPLSRRAFLTAAAVTRPPNFILVLADNLGYGDIGCYGSKIHRTPHLDRMAQEGARLTSFYVASGVCTPSRAAIMTGCYPRRVGLHHTQPDGYVLRPVSPNGLHPDEVTIAEVLKTRGYATAIIGKWHLGDQPGFLPTRQGFDSYFGIPYSDDQVEGRGSAPPLPLMENERVIEAPVDRDYLTQRYTRRAVQFIEQNRSRPFFLYLAQAMPGSTPNPYSSPAFKGKSANGAYGDSVEELDWSQGQILDALRKNGLDGESLVVWMADNGAVRRNPVQGSNLPLGGWGYTTQEGGQRVPCLVRWPGRIPPGRTISALTTAMDWLPTFAALAGAKAPRTDGRNIWRVLTAPGEKSPHKAFFYYYGEQLQAVRSGPWKLYLALQEKLVSLQNAVKPAELALYNVETDPGETANVANGHPDVVRQLTRLAEIARRDLGDRNRPGTGQRPSGRVQHPTPRRL